MEASTRASNDLMSHKYYSIGIFAVFLSIILIRGTFFPKVDTEESELARLHGPRLAPEGTQWGQRRVSFCTLNAWNNMVWKERKKSLRLFAETFRPDIWVLQEASPELLSLLDDALPRHQRVVPTPGQSAVHWKHESNIYWNADLFTMSEYGHEPLPWFQDAEYQRGLHWVRLHFGAVVDRRKNDTILASTAHYLWEGNKYEVQSAQNLRIEQSKFTVKTLEELANQGEGTLFAGDLNDSYHPYRIFHLAGWKDVFGALGLQQATTYPTPTSRLADRGPGTAANAFDWIFVNKYIRPIAAQVVDNFALAGGVQPSDHMPVCTIVEVAESRRDYNNDEDPSS